MGRLDEIQATPLVLAGRRDFIFPPEHQALIADRLPNARLNIIEKSGHSAPERAKEIIRLMKDFITYNDNLSGLRTCSIAAECPCCRE